MKKIVVLSVILAISLIYACKKGESLTLSASTSNNNPPPPITATIRFTNNSSNPYNIYLNGTYQFQLAGGYYKDVTENTGIYTYEVIQQSGYLVYPTDEKGSFTLTTSGETVTFP